MTLIASCPICLQRVCALLPDATTEHEAQAMIGRIYCHACGGTCNIITGGHSPTTAPGERVGCLETRNESGRTYARARVQGGQGSHPTPPRSNEVRNLFPRGFAQELGLT